MISTSWEMSFWNMNFTLFFLSYLCWSGGLFITIAANLLLSLGDNPFPPNFLSA